jgi:hypothetical protein
LLEGERSRKVADPEGQRQCGSLPPQCAADIGSAAAGCFRPIEREIERSARERFGDIGSALQQELQEGRMGARPLDRGAQHGVNRMS